MKIELEEDEIKSALVAYINSQGFSIDEARAEVDLKNARGDFGVTATISMAKAVTSVAPAEPKKVTDIKQESTKAKESAKEKSKGNDDDEAKEPASNKPLFG